MYFTSPNYRITFVKDLRFSKPRRRYCIDFAWDQFCTNSSPACNWLTTSSSYFPKHEALPFFESLPTGFSPSLLSWLARSFCFFLLVASSAPRAVLLWPGMLALLDIFSRLDETNGPPGSVTESGSGVRRFLPGPAILATLCGQSLRQGTKWPGAKRKHKDCKQKMGQRSFADTFTTDN